MFAGTSVSGTYLLRGLVRRIANTVRLSLLVDPAKPILAPPIIDATGDHIAGIEQQ